MPLSNPSTVTVNFPRGRSETATVASINASTTSGVLLAANPNRQSASFFNTATSRLHISLSATASLTAYTAYLEPGGYYEIPTPYTGVVSGIWVSADANGRCQVTEMIDAVD